MEFKKSKEECVADMKEIAKDSIADPERAHEYADELLCEILIKEGYKEVVDAFKDVYKWYA